MSDAWEVFCASLDLAQLERERMRVVSVLKHERPGGRRDRQIMWAHEKRAVEFWKSADSGSWSPLPDVPDVKRRSPLVPRPVVAKSASARMSRSVIPAGRQLQIALAALERQEQAVAGPVRRSDGLSGSNSSTRSTGVSAVSDANESTNGKKAA